jgi:hypothetical protein
MKSKAKIIMAMNKIRKLSKRKQKKSNLVLRIIIAMKKIRKLLKRKQKKSNLIMAMN